MSLITTYLQAQIPDWIGWCWNHTLYGIRGWIHLPQRCWGLAWIERSRDRREIRIRTPLRELRLAYHPPSASAQFKVLVDSQLVDCPWELGPRLPDQVQLWRKSGGGSRAHSYAQVEQVHLLFP